MSTRPGPPATGKGQQPRHRAGASLTDELLGDILAELRDINTKLDPADPPASTGGRVRIQEPAPEDQG